MYIFSSFEGLHYYKLHPLPACPTLTSGQLTPPVFMTLERKGEGEMVGQERENSTDFWFHLFLNSLLDYCMCPDWVLNLQP